MRSLKPDTEIAAAGRLSVRELWRLQGWEGSTQPVVGFHSRPSIRTADVVHQTLVGIRGTLLYKGKLFLCRVRLDWPEHLGRCWGEGRPYRRIRAHSHARGG
jgi:hypothetical protein